ncbi:RTA1 like protein-domain-containing protein [Aspergillus karnatakaensis]|uniref:RTA1 domain-containing protein n=1 Tax=Aspergillus karnatakaensis TaxID=1810916 RepID=UPI003CCD1001
MAEQSFYKYDPSIPGSVIAFILFGVSTIFHTWQLFKEKTWFFTAFLVGAYMMTLGYIARTFSALHTSNLSLFIAQNLFIILPPSLYAATIYMTYGRIVIFIRKDHLSLIAPKRVTKLFVVGDVAAFILQLAGGGMQTVQSMASAGEKLLIGGLFVQLLFFAFFLFVAGSFQVRLHQCGYRSGWRDCEDWRRLLHVLFVVSALIIARCLFRIVEYAQGYNGYLLRHEVYMYVFDMVPMLVVQVVFHFWYPGGIITPGGGEGVAGKGVVVDGDEDEVRLRGV